MIAVVALALAGCSDAKSGDASGREPSELASTPATTPTEDSDNTATQTQSGATIVGAVPDGALQPGSYALQPIGPLDEPYAVVDIAGSGYHSWAVFIEADEPVVPEDPLMLGLWAITGVYLDPCTPSHLVQPEVVRGVAEAFAQQQLTSSTRPRKIELAGYRGLYMEVTTPKHLDYGACDDAELNLWAGDPDGTYWTRMPGMVNKLWILDVDGRPMMISVAVPPAATGRQVDAMDDMVEAASFEASTG